MSPVAVGGLLAVAMAAAGAASPAPVSDPAARGFIALCDLAGHNVGGGKIETAPLAWRAVSSVPAPGTFRGNGQSATLYVYQVREDTAPAYWSGDQLSAASFYRDRRHPAAEMTYKDFSLADIIKEFPPLDSGLYQLRMKVGKLNYATYTDTYPSTLIQVTGRTWHVVQGGRLPCGSSTRATSTELFSGHSQLASHPDRNQTPATAPPGARLTAASAPGRSGSGDAVRHESEAGADHTAAYLGGGVAVALVGVMAVGLLVRRRKRP